MQRNKKEKLDVQILKSYKIRLKYTTFYILTKYISIE